MAWSLRAVASRAPRCDAIRNRQRIFAAAREQLSARGPDTGMQEIATAAGVAVGTLYRHFPTKADLISAVVAAHVAEVGDDAEASLGRARAGSRALDELVGFLDRTTDAIAQNHAAKAVQGGPATTPGGAGSDEARGASATAELVALAQADGDVRANLTIDDVYLVIGSVPTDQGPERRRRWLELVLSGLLAR